MSGHDTQTAPLPPSLFSPHDLCFQSVRHTLRHHCDHLAHVALRNFLHSSGARQLRHEPRCSSKEEMDQLSPVDGCREACRSLIFPCARLSKRFLEHVFQKTLEQTAGVSWTKLLKSRCSGCGKLASRLHSYETDGQLCENLREVPRSIMCQRNSGTADTSPGCRRAAC